MAWGTKTITRKFMKYAQRYVGWATFAEVSRPVPNVLAVRVTAPFFEDTEVFLNGSMWWLADSYDPTSRFNSEPRPLCPLDAYEADVAVAIARAYLTALAMQIGTRNEELVPAAFQRVMTEGDEHGDTRREAFIAVMQYLALVAQGVAHREKRTQKMAHELFQQAEPTLREFQQPRAFMPPPPFVPPADASEKARRAEEEEPEFADWGEDEETESEAYERFEAEIRTDFEAQPIAAFCKAVGIEPSLELEPWGYPLSFGDRRGLQIGESIRGVSIVLNGTTTEWYLESGISGEGPDGWNVLHRWDIAGAGVADSYLSDRTTAALRNLASRSQDSEQNAILGALLAWGALTDRADETIWAVKAISAGEDLGHRFPNNGNHAAKVLIEGPFATEKQVRKLLRWFDPDHAEV